MTRKIRRDSINVRDKDFKRYGPYSDRIQSRYLTLPTGVELRVVSYYRDVSKYPPVVMVTGLASVMESSREITRALTREFTVHYVETREKSSSRTNGNKDFGIAAIGKDIAHAIIKLGLNDKKYILFGASLGATAIIDAYRFLELRPTTLVMLEPNASFKIPLWGRPLIHLSSYAYRLIKPIAKYYIKNYRVNIQEDYEMYKISSRALDAADPYKLKKAVLGLTRYEVWDNLRNIDTPTLIVAASKDYFHNHQDIVQIADLITDCTFIDLETHKRTHSKELVTTVKNYLQQQSNTLIES